MTVYRANVIMNFTINSNPNLNDAHDKHDNPDESLIKLFKMFN